MPGASSATLAQLQVSPAGRSSKCPPDWVRAPVCARGTGITTLPLLAGVGVGLDQVPVCLCHWGPVHQQCFPAHLAGPGPPAQGAGKPGRVGCWAQLSWAILAGALTQVLRLPGQATNSAATCEKTPSFPPGYWGANLFHLLRQKDK